MTKILNLKKVFAKIAIFSIKMSESKISFMLAQATNTYKHISRNIGATITASRKLAHGKVFFNFFTKRHFFTKQIALQSKNVIALNLYIDINELVYERRLMMKVFDKVFVLQTYLLQKQLYLF